MLGSLQLASLLFTWFFSSLSILFRFFFFFWFDYLFIFLFIRVFHFIFFLLSRFFFSLNIHLCRFVVGLFVRSWVRYFSIMWKMYLYFVFFFIYRKQHTDTHIRRVCIWLFFSLFILIVFFSCFSIRHALANSAWFTPFSFHLFMLFASCAKNISKANLSYQTHHQQHSALRHVGYTIQSRPY